MSYFGDIYDDAEKRMGDGEYEIFDDGKLFKEPGCKLLSAKIKSSPGNGLSLSQGVDMVKGKKEGSFDHKHKTEVKYASGEHEGKGTFTNKDGTLEWTYSPDQFCKDGKEVTFQVENKMNPAANEMEFKFENKCGGYPMGSITGWSELQYNMERKEAKPDKAKMAQSQAAPSKGGLDGGANAGLSQSQAAGSAGSSMAGASSSSKMEMSHSVTFSQVLNHSDFWFSGSVSASFNAKPELDSAGVGLLWKNGAWDMWTRANILAKAYGAGFTWRQTNRQTHSCELYYNKAEKDTGLFGTPLYWRYGFGLKSDNVTWGLRAQYNNNRLLFCQKTEAPLDKNTKLTLTLQDESLSWFTKREAAMKALKVGFAMEYKC